ncbi:MAG: GntR family transcriptional regulator [Ruminococcaceae bacterium]|nr:GntR family transcriptional regulator [Oscillospiraceae bacterium]
MKSYREGGAAVIKLDMQSRKPIYEQLKEQILRLTMLGVLSADEKLPSVRSLARDVGINPNTVQKAYQELERDGIIYIVGGKGSFVAGNDEGVHLRRQKALDEVAAAVRQACDSGCSEEEILQRVRESIKEGTVHD